MSSNSLVNVPPPAPPAPIPAKPVPAVKRSSRAVRYLAQAVQLEESGTTPLVRFAMISAGLACLSFITWAGLTRIDEVAVTEGQVVPTSAIQTIQHLEGGIVEELQVVEGELVESGQPLIRLSPFAAMADLDQARAREMTLLLKSERLRALTEGRQADFSFAGTGYERLVGDNLAIFNTQTQSRDTARAVLTSQIDQKRSDLRMLEKQQLTWQQQVSALNDILKMREDLLAQGLVSRIVHLDNKRELARVQGELARTIGQTITAREALAESEQRLVDQTSTLHRQSMDELGIAIAELAQVQETIGRLEDRVKRLVVTAPLRGYVKGMAVHNPGAVLQPGGLVTEIVPVDQKMKVEARVLPRDIGHLKIGQEVKVKVSTYDFARYGAIHGELQSVSASSFLNEKGEPYFKAQISLDQDYVGRSESVHIVTPGMTVSAEVITGDKTLLQYLLKPIFTQVQQSFHER